MELLCSVSTFLCVFQEHTKKENRHRIVQMCNKLDFFKKISLFDFSDSIIRFLGFRNYGIIRLWLVMIVMCI